MSKTISCSRRQHLLFPFPTEISRALICKIILNIKQRFFFFLIAQIQRESCCFHQKVFSVTISLDFKFPHIREITMGLCRKTEQDFKTTSANNFKLDL